VARHLDQEGVGLQQQLARLLDDAVVAAQVARIVEGDHVHLFAARTLIFLAAVSSESNCVWWITS
jgi:hypothetical protein